MHHATLKIKMSVCEHLEMRLRYCTADFSVKKLQTE